MHQKQQLNAVIFDYGGVLSLSPTAEDWDRMAEILRLPLDFFLGRYWGFRHDYDLNLYDKAAYWRKVAGPNATHITDVVVQQLDAQDNQQWGKENSKAVALARHVRETGLKTAILSNIEDSMLAYIRGKFAWVNEFDVQTYSCELGIAKPQKEIFLHTAKQLETPPEKILFVDDRSENIEGAIRAGLRVLQFDPTRGNAALEKTLWKAGVNLQEIPPENVSR